MNQDLTLSDVLDAADLLSIDEQAELISILRRRLVDAARQQLFADVREARQEFTEGRCIPTAPSEIMHEILK
jgi:hypothetical protein